MSLTIRPLNTGWVVTSPKSYLYHPSVHKYYPAIPDHQIELPDYCFLVEGGEKLLLVDTGMAWTQRADDLHHPGSYQPEGMAIHEQLAAVGVSAEDVEIIALTHLHWDHAYYLEKFTNATIYVHADELAFAEDPIGMYYKSYESEKMGHGVTPHFKMAELTAITGEVELMPGVRTMPTPGHSPGHMSIEIDTADGNYLCCGDSIFCEDNLNPVPELHYEITPPARFVDAVQTWHSIVAQRERVKDDSFILGAHFASLVDRFAETPVLGV